MLTFVQQILKIFCWNLQVIRVAVASTYTFTMKFLFVVLIVYVQLYYTSFSVFYNEMLFANSCNEINESNTQKNGCLYNATWDQWLN